MRQCQCTSWPGLWIVQHGLHGKAYCVPGFTSKIVSAAGVRSFSQRKLQVKWTTNPSSQRASVSRRARSVQAVQHARECEAAVRGVIRRQCAAARHCVTRMAHLHLQLACQPEKIACTS